MQQMHEEVLRYYNLAGRIRVFNTPLEVEKYIDALEREVMLLRERIEFLDFFSVNLPT